MYLICSVQVKFLPKNVIDLDYLICLLFMYSSGRAREILSFLFGLGKKEYLNFVTFKDNLFEKSV